MDPQWTSVYSPNPHYQLYIVAEIMLLSRGRTEGAFLNYLKENVTYKTINGLNPVA